MTAEIRLDGAAADGSGAESGRIRSDSSETPLVIPTADLLSILQGVTVAAKISDDDATLVRRWLAETAVASTPHSTGTDSTSKTMHGWCSEVETRFEEDEDSRHIALVTIAVASLRDSGRRGITVQGDELDIVWAIVRNALTSKPESKLRWAASRSAQGFLAVPLCSLIKDGNIDELFRLHVWLPDGLRGNPDFAVHSHQPFAQSWILAGEGTDTSYEVGPVATIEEATHTKYALTWAEVRDEGSTTYKTHQHSSVAVNTGEFMRAEAVHERTHSRGMNYTVPAASFHTSGVSPGLLHATLFFFDASRGFVKDAPVLGPKAGESFTQVRDPAGTTPGQLVGFVDTVREWETFMDRGRHHMDSAEWEHALRELNRGLHLCLTKAEFPNAQRYECIIHGELGNTYRRFGRYIQAESHLRKAIDGLPVCMERVEYSGELGVLYRHLNRLEDARSAFLDQYTTATALGFDRPACRAIGNLGMVNYQIFSEGGDEVLLNTAVQNLTDRVESARRLQEKARKVDPNGTGDRQARIWEIIGLTRLSLCHSIKGNTEQAIETASLALEATITSKDTTVIALTRLFYGFALLKDGQKSNALEQFNPPNVCTPAMALCKEPSAEHLQYLRELVDAGADLDLVDEQGYTALDYVVFSGDAEMETIVLEGLRQVPGRSAEEILQRKTEAALRKGYRELFQEELRPVLLGGGSGSVERLRARYSAELSRDQRKADMFDLLKYIRYSDFLSFGRFSRSDDSLAKTFTLDGGHEAGEYIVFVSYRWLSTATVSSSPDDDKNTQYNRVISAIEELLKLHPEIVPSRLSIWLDYACVDQDGPAKGVAALPMILAQCNAVISLVDQEYYNRAWCSVEVMMVQTLKKSYHLHEWYEQVPDEGSSDTSSGTKWSLRPGPMDMAISMAEKKITLEEDRAKTLFLERQARLLGTH